MNLDFAALQEILAEWPNMEIPQQRADDAICERIRQLLCIAREVGPSMAWKGDFQPLMRHFLLRQSARATRQVNLLVPMREDWPTVKEWEAHGFSTLARDKKGVILTARPWHPAWLGSNESGVFADAFTESMVRTEGRCSADPFFRDATGYDQYSCPGQREAVRAAFLMKPAHTLIVNLPTGSGKSLVGQAPALVLAQEGALTLFVVPTIALAMDQARQMTEYLQKSKGSKQAWPLAWHGGLLPEGRQEVLRRMRAGTQRILFTSPEALTTSLLRTVFDVARSGLLQYLVIDEAHLVAQWGDEFRPAFQALAGVRNALLRQGINGGFRTLLLSATFTTETVETLANLFGPPDQVEMISAVHLRPEPQYWFSRASSRSDKVERILEALRYAPRPFILYVTTRKDASDWLDILRDRGGLRRIELFDGATPANKREQIIREWAANHLDGIVATSAFGVGIDKGDVRAVIHATIPETLDRFYQEVGRGGRDGRPSISLLVYDDTDWSGPERLATPKIISDQLGFERWKALYASRTLTNDAELLEIDLEAIPKHLRSSNDYNVSWNMRTLLLMSRARLIELEVESNIDRALLDTEEFSPSSPLAAMASVRVRIINGAHQLSDVWEQAVAPIRSSTQESAQNSLRLMKALLSGTREVSQTFADFYKVRSTRWPVDVTRVCGGCPADRFTQQERSGYQVPVASPIHHVQNVGFGTWKSHFPWLDSVSALVFYDDEVGGKMAQHGIMKFLGWLVSECDVQELATDRDSPISKLLAWTHLYRRSSSGVLIHRDLNQLAEEPYSPLARVTIVDTQFAMNKIPSIWLLRRPHHLVLLPKRTPAPDNPNRFLMHVAANVARLDQLLAIIAR